MAERQTGLTTPARDQERLARNRPLASGGNPFRMLQRFADDVDRMFDEAAFGRQWHAPRGFRTAAEAWAPDVEVFQKNSELTIKADLPGLSKDEVSVHVADNAVTIEGERKREHEEERDGFLRSERTYGSFCRVIPLPEGAISEQAKASFRNGVLEITMPAAPAAQGRRLEITEGPKK
jgi:HSP20 family protein